jgi:tripartite-type tricarboxylate transporter receptor subunit TctC
MPLTFYRLLFLFVTFSLISSALIAKDFPSKPINLVVPFAPGGGTDSIARDLAKNLTEQLGQTVIVDNRAGGGGAIGAQMVAKAEPDGHTLLFVTSTFITHAATENNLSYDVIKDFTPIAMIGRGPLMVVANSELGLSSIQDLVKYTKANPNGVNFCSAGQGSINHLAGELFKQKTNLEMTHVPYKGSGPATLDLLGR